MVLLVLESDSMNFNTNHAPKISKIHRAKLLWDSIKYLIDKLKKIKWGRKLHPSISTHNLLYFIIPNSNVFFFLIFTLKDKVFYVAENHLTLKVTEPKVYVKWKDLETHQWKKACYSFNIHTRLCLSLFRMNEVPDDSDFYASNQDSIPENTRQMECLKIDDKPIKRRCSQEGE